MRTTTLSLIALATAALLACEGAELRRPLGSPPSDARDDADAIDGDAEDDTDGEVGPDQPFIELWFVGETGELGRGMDEVTLLAEDEPADYLDVPGFQIDVAVETRGVAAGQDVRLTVDGLISGTLEIELDSDDLGSARIFQLTLPDSADPFVVRVETEDVDGNNLDDEKDVRLELGGCRIEARIELGPEGCVELDPDLIAPPFQAARVDVSLLTGECDRVSGVAHLGQTDVTLAQQTFGPDGIAVLVVPVNPGSDFQGDLVVDLTAHHPDDPANDVELAVSERLDLVAPRVEWITPPPGAFALTIDDDLDNDPDNGIQYVVEAHLEELSVGEVVLARLFLNDDPVGEQETGPGLGNLVFDVTFEAGPATLTLELSDDCGNDHTASRELDIITGPGTLTIIDPDDGDVLLAADDLVPGSAAIYDTRFTLSAPNLAPGTTLIVLCQPADELDPEAWTEVGRRTVQTPAASYTVEIAADVSVVGQASRCIARATGVEEDRESAPIRVTFAVPPPTLIITEPPSGACIRSDTVTIAGIATGLDGRSVDLSGAGPNPEDGPIDDPGFATVGTGAASGDWSGTYNFGDLDNDGPWQFTVSATDQFGNETSASVSIIVDRVAPVLTFTAPPEAIDATVTADGNPNQPGFQTTVVVSVDEATSATGGPVCLSVNGATATCQDMVPSVSFANVTLLPGDNSLLATGEDACLNGAFAVTRTINLTVPNPISIVAPGDGSTLLAAGDGVPATTTVYDFTITVDADNATTGATLTIECRAAGATDFSTVATRTITAVAANGVYDIPAAIDTGTYTNNVECRARVNQPAPGISDIVDWVLAIPAPTVTLTAPAANACLNGDIAAAGAATGLDSLDVSANLVELDGDPVASGTGTAAAGAWAATIPLGATPDGSYGVFASATDAFGNPVTSGNPRGIAIDRTAPLVAITAPDEDVTEADDSSNATGIQVDIVATYQDARAGGEVCLDLNGASTCRAAAATVAFPDVTVQPGDNLVTITATDACGNAALPALRTLHLELDAPTVVITTPAQDLTTAATTFDIVVRVTDSGVPLTGLDVTLLAGVTDTGITPTGAANGTYRFEDVPLPPGVTTTFTAEAVRPNSALGISGPRKITQKNVAPTITLSAPTDDTVFNLASAACAAGQTSCVTTVSATTTNAEEGSAAKIDVTCGTTVTTYNNTVSANAVAFTNVTLADQSTCTIAPSVTDLVEQTASGTIVDVVVDRIGPTVDITAPPSALQANDDDDPNTAGMQHPLTADIAGVAAGATVTAVLTWNAGGAQTKTLTHTVTTTTPDNGNYVASFQEAATPGLVSWPDAAVTVVVSVADSHGNPGSDTLVVTIDSTPTIRITGPALVPADTCAGGCAAGTVCQDGMCWIGWGSGASRQLVTVVAGISTTTANLRACSDHPSLAGTGAATCTSTASATGPFREVRVASTGNGVAILDVSADLPEGAQRLVAEVLPTQNGSWISSQAAADATERERRVIVDLQTPQVTAIFSTSDTQLPAGTLNAAEQLGTPRIFQLVFNVDEPGFLQLFVNGTLAHAQDVDTGITINLTLPEGQPDIWAVITDRVGNGSPATPALGALTYQPIVDVTPPTLAFSYPTKSPVVQGESLDVTLTSDAAGRTVTLSDGGNPIGTATVTGGSATFANALTQGSHTLTASVSDAALNTVSAATTPTTIVVDTIPPTGTIVTPADNSILLSDADPVAPGWQVSVTFSTSDGGTGWTISSAKGCDASYAGCLAPVVEATGTVTNPGGNEPAVSVTLDLDAAVTFQKIILTTSDAVGNTHVDEARVQVVSSCAVAFLDLPTNGWFNADNCPSAGGCATAQVSITVGLSGLCTTDSIVLYDGATELDTISDDSQPFVITVNDADALDLEAIAYQGASEVTSTGVVPIGVDLTPPDVAFISTTQQGFVTAADGEAVTWDFEDDLAPGTPGMQFHAAVRVTDLNADGGVITALTSSSTAGTVDLDPTNGDIPLDLSGTSPIDQALLGMTLADDLVHTVTVTAEDAAGNSDTSSFTATVDVTPPETVVVVGVTVERRRPRFTVSWTAIAMSGGLPDAYEVRYSANAIATENDWDGACDATDAFGTDPMPAPAPEGQPMSLAIGGPDTRPLSDACKLDVRFDDGSTSSDVVWTFAVRARDGGGNLSALSDEAVIDVTYAEVVNSVSIVRFINTGNVFGSNGALISRRGALIGDITGDGRQEWAAFSPNTNGFCIVRGVASLPADQTIDTLSGANHVCLVGSGADAIFTGLTQTGHHVASLGDVNGDGVGDFGVSGRFTGNTEGYVAIWLGVSGALPNLSAPNIRIRGIDIATGGSFGNEYSGFCSAGDFDGLFQVTNWTSDIAIGETATSTVWVIPGQTSWTSATSLTFADPSAIGVDRWHVSATPASWGSPPAAPVLGFRCGPAGDVVPTPPGLGNAGLGDLLVAQNGSNDARVFVFPGRSFSGDVAETVSETVPSATGTAEDFRALRLRQEFDGFRAGFGSSLQGGVDVNQDGLVDVLVGHSLRTVDNMQIHLFDGARLVALAGSGGQDVRIGVSGAAVDDTWTGTNGWIVRAVLNLSIPNAVRLIGDFDGWLAGAPPAATIDLVFGDSTGESVFLKLNHLRPAAGIALGGFPVLDGEIVNRYRPAGTTGAIGTWVDGGADMNGDGLRDLLSGSNLGEVVIVH